MLHACIHELLQRKVSLDSASLETEKSVLIFEALTPLQKGLNLGERPSPLFHLLLKSVLFDMCLLSESLDPEEI